MIVNGIIIVNAHSAGRKGQANNSQALSAVPSVCYCGLQRQKEKDCATKSAGKRLRVGLKKAVTIHNSFSDCKVSYEEFA